MVITKGLPLVHTTISDPNLEPTDLSQFFDLWTQIPWRRISLKSHQTSSCFPPRCGTQLGAEEIRIGRVAVAGELILGGLGLRCSGPNVVGGSNLSDF